MLRILGAIRLAGAVSAASLLGSQQAGVQETPRQTVSIPVVQQLPSGEGEAVPQDEEAAFAGYVQLLAARARADGVSEATISAMTAGLSPNPRVVALDRAQPGQGNSGAIPLFAPYQRRHVDAARIAAGRRTYDAVAGLIPAIERKYGVPAPVLLAIWGHETNYGSFKGNFDLARSLATLAFEGRRRELFADEFVALLRIADSGVSRSQLVGSWAGAFGNPQFLPSMYLRLAVDGDGDGRRDIWNSRADTLASIANYFRDAGWRPGQPWGVAAAIPEGFDVDAQASLIVAPTCPRVHARHSRWRKVSDWRRLGVEPLSPLAGDVMASLFQPDGPGTPAYLLTGNYRVILHYNCSNFYALSVGLLADEIAR